MIKLINKEKAIVSVGIILAFSVVQKGVSFLREVLFARLLGPSDYGIFILSIFFIQLIGSFAVMGVPSCYARYIIQYENKGLLKAFLKRTYSFALLVGCGVVVLCFIFSKYISLGLLGTEKFVEVVVLSIFAILPLMFYKHIIASFNGLRIFRMSSFMESLHVILYTVLGIILLKHASQPYSAVLANVISFACVTVLFGGLLAKAIAGEKAHEGHGLENDFDRKILKFSIWFMITPVIFMIFNYVDRLMLNQFLGLYDVGVYSVASNITQLVFIVGMIVGNVLMPNLSHKWEDGGRRNVQLDINLAMKVTMLILLLASVGIVVFKAELISLLYGREYTLSLKVVSPLLIFWLLNSMIWILGVYPQLIERTHLTLVAYLPGLLLNVFLNRLLIPQYGMTGAAVATVLSFALISILALIIYGNEGLYIEKKTFLMLASPLILMFNNHILILSACIILLLSLSTECIISKEERALLMGHLKRSGK